MAAAESPVQELCEELTCFICLDYYKDPVTIAECGHNFCGACLSQCWGESRTESCPQCREKVKQRNLTLNRQLGNVAKIPKKLSLQWGKRAEGKARVCERHQEPLKLFCKDDETLICVVCDRSKEHRDHKIFPLEEASEGYKHEIWKCLEALREERDKIMVYKADTEKESQNLFKQTAAEREKTMDEFRQLRQLLEEQEKLLLDKLAKVEEEIARKRDEHLAKLSEELSSLESIIQEMEEKHQQSVGELLQDIGSFLQRCEKKEKFENPVAFPPTLKGETSVLSDIAPFLEDVMKQFRDQSWTNHKMGGSYRRRRRVESQRKVPRPAIAVATHQYTYLLGQSVAQLPRTPLRRVVDVLTSVGGKESLESGMVDAGQAT